MATVYGDTVATGYTSLYAATHSPPPQLVAMYEIPQGRIYTFTSHKKFKEDLQRCADAFISGAGKQYIAFRDVQQYRLRLIEHRRKRAEIPAFRFLYDAAEEVLIIKLKLGAHHEVANSTFATMFIVKLFSLEVVDTLVSLGSTRYEALTGRSKEADGAWHPSTRILPTDWPSLVIEVGVSESLGQLRTDADFWLTKSGSQTRVVILLAVNKATRVMKIERWEDVPSPRPRRRTSPPHNPTMVQTLTLHANGLVIDGPLLIPASKVYDTLPPGLGQNDFTFTAQDLAQYIQRYWLIVG